MPSFTAHLWGCVSSLRYYRYVYHRYSAWSSVTAFTVALLMISLLISWSLMSIAMPDDPGKALHSLASSATIEQLLPADLMITYSMGTFQVNQPTPHVVPLPEHWRHVLSSLFDTPENTHSLNSKAYVLLEHQVWQKLRKQADSHGQSLVGGSSHVIENFLVIDHSSGSKALHNSVFVLSNSSVALSLWVDGKYSPLEMNVDLEDVEITLHADLVRVFVHEIASLSVFRWPPVVHILCESLCMAVVSSVLFGLLLYSTVFWTAVLYAAAFLLLGEDRAHLRVVGVMQLVLHSFVPWIVLQVLIDVDDFWLQILYFCAMVQLLYLVIPAHAPADFL